MPAANVNGSNGNKRASAATNLIAGGGAGMMEALACHPLDTIKVRMQLSRRARTPGVNIAGYGYSSTRADGNQTKRRGFLTTGKDIIKRESPLALYKGLGAVMTGIIPKMAIRFTSYEWYKQFLADKTTGEVSGRATFLAGLSAGVTEAILVVTPMEVVKIRLQAQFHSMTDPLDIPRYRNAAHAAFTVVREEGMGALYRGVSLTALRQGTNQAVNFTAYAYFKSVLQRLQPDTTGDSQGGLPSWQTMGIGLVSGAMGPLSNAPIDTIKTRLQRMPAEPGQSAISRIQAIIRDMIKHEGVRALYQGITPRIMRVAPGQAVTFTVYEYLKGILEGRRAGISGGKYEE